MDANESRHWLLNSAGMRPGTEAIRRALALWDDPQDRLRVVHVAGTNGKGSVCEMLRAVAEAAEYRVGTFLSPSPFSDGVAVRLGADWDLSRQAELLTEIRDTCGTAGVSLSTFEIQTLATVLYFSRSGCDLAIFECGMGGRLDATNVFASPLCCVLTAVSPDHTAFLGDTVERITAEKCGILRPGCDAVTVPDQNEAALAVLFEQAAGCGATVHLPGGTPQILSQTLTGTTFRLGETVYSPAMPGAFQVSNARTVLTVCDVLSGKGYTFTEEAKQQGLAAAKLPCRQELIPGTPPILLDGSHNPAGVAALAQTLTDCGKTAPLTALWGMLRDKDCAACVRQLAPFVKQAVCCTPESDRALPAEELADLFREAGVPATAEPDIAAALCKAKRLAIEDLLIVGGSFYTAFPVRALLP